MIIKSQARKSIKSIGQLLEYVTRADALYKTEDGRTLILKNNLRGQSLDGWCAQYITNEEGRVRKMKGTNAVYHEILAWHELDRTNITIEKLERMAREYIRLRNPNALVLATAHSDKDHIHIHFVVSGVQKGTGESLRVSRDTFKQMKLDMETYQQQHFPELVHSVVEHERNKNVKAKSAKANITEKEYQMKLKGKPTEKEKLMADIKLIQQTARTEEQFIEMLQQMGYKPYYRNGRFAGVEKKRKYRLDSLYFQIKQDINPQTDITYLR